MWQDANNINSMRDYYNSHKDTMHDDTREAIESTITGWEVGRPPRHFPKYLG